MPALYKTATAAPGRSPANLAIYQDADQYYDQFHGSHVFDLISGYGCDPTGVTECSTAVNQAFTDAAAGSVGGHTALVTGYGTLKVNKTINVNADNIMLMGLGGGDVDHIKNGLTFKKDSAGFTGSYILDFFGTTSQPLGGCRIKNVTIDGNSRGGTNITGLRWSVFNGTVEDVQIGYCSGNGIEVVGAVGPPAWNTYNTCLNRVTANANLGIGFFINPPSTDGHATDCFAYYNGVDTATHNTQLNAAADGMQINSSGWQIYGFHAYSNGGHGLNVVGGVLAAQCSGGYLENNFKAGFYTDNTVSGCAFRLINNFIWDNGRGANNTFPNVQIATAAAHGTQVICQGNHIRASGNANHPTFGVDLFSANAQSCIVSDNYIEGSYGLTGTGPVMRSNGSGVAGVACFVKNNAGWNPRGLVAAPISLATLGSGVASTPNNFFNESATVYIATGATSPVTAIAIGGSTTGMTIPASQGGSIRVNPGQSVAVTWTGANAPVWSWFLD